MQHFKPFPIFFALLLSACNAQALLPVSSFSTITSSSGSISAPTNTSSSASQTSYSNATVTTTSTTSTQTNTHTRNPTTRLQSTSVTITTATGTGGASVPTLIPSNSNDAVGQAKSSLISLFIAGIFGLYLLA